jgi:two-component system chemotaxis response regulator CheB
MRVRDGTSEPRPLQVLVVDDSAVVRQVMTTLLSSEPGFVVTTASDPLIAMEKMKRARPDVIILDIHMPRMDGLTFLRQIMERDPIPVVVCSGVAESGTEAAFRAMAEGAVDIVRKPKVGIREFLYESAVTLIDAVRAASQARIGMGPRPRARVPGGSTTSMRPPALARAQERIVAIGASTGGPEALRGLLDAMPADGPATLIVQHMPELFTRAFANRLNTTSAMEVKEAKNGDRVARGRALLAPGNSHMRLVRQGGQYCVEVKEGPLVSRHRPSVDVLFHSVAEVAGAAAVGVLLTGMGDDGAEGLLQMKLKGAKTIAQDEASCVVFGMPAKAIKRGGACEIVSLLEIPAAILDLCAYR